MRGIESRSFGSCSNPTMIAFKIERALLRKKGLSDLADGLSVAMMIVLAMSLQSVSSSILLKMFQLKLRTRSSGLNRMIFFFGLYLRVIAASLRHISGLESMTMVERSGSKQSL